MNHSRRNQRRTRRTGRSKAILIGLPLLVAALLALAAGIAGTQQPDPRMEIETVAVDLGDVTNGVIETGQIPIRNDGAGDLVIADVSTSCGCTQAAVIPATIPPGGEGMLEFSFDSGAHGPELTGPMLRQIFVHSNDGARPQLVVDVSVNILPRVSAAP